MTICRLENAAKSAAHPNGRRRDSCAEIMEHLTALITRNSYAIAAKS